MARPIGAILIAAGTLAALSSCNQDKASNYAPDLRPISCAVGGGGELTETCTFERAYTGDEALVVLHDARGGLRRFAYNPDSKALTAADGADIAVSHYNAPKMQIELHVAGSVYHIPIAYFIDGDDVPSGAEKGG